jgi:integral membrane protein
MQQSVKRFRQIGLIEGYSYLILLFIAMPLKYFAGFPIAVKIAGMAHGILFIVFCILLAKAWQDAKWSAYESTLFFVASLIPFGTFYTDKMVKKYE